MDDKRRPTHDLSRAKDLVAAGDWIWAHRKAQGEALVNGYLNSDVESRFESLTSRCFEKSSALKPSDFGVSSAPGPLLEDCSKDRWLDVYITEYEGKRIYVKFEVMRSKERDFVFLWSCHPAVR